MLRKLELFGVIHLQIEGAQMHSILLTKLVH
jgi:hypothetical protein